MSGGEQQMLAVGRALMAGPKLLMLDEPSLGLAPKVAAGILDTLGELNRNGLGILLVEQKAPLALKLARRVYVLSSGSVRAELPAHEIKSHHDLARYLLPLSSAATATSPSRGAVFIALLFAFVFIKGGYLLTVMQLAMIYGVFCVGLNFFMGYTGQASFGQNAFAAIGGYGTAILCVEYGWEPVLALVVVDGDRRRRRGCRRLSDPAAARPLPCHGDLRARPHHLRHVGPVDEPDARLHGLFRHSAARHRPVHDRGRAHEARLPDGASC